MHGVTLMNYWIGGGTVHKVNKYYVLYSKYY